ncbi:MAG: HAMP domain-containing sensor histidine kinase [Gemmatimonadota bacterium]
MTVRTRLIASLGTMGIILILPALVGLGRLTELRNIAVDLRDRQAAATMAIGSLQASLTRFDQVQRRYIIVPDPTFRAGMREALDQAVADVSTLNEAGYEDEVAFVMAEISWLGEATGRIEELMESGREMQATEYFEGVKPRLAGTIKALEPIAESIDRATSASAGRAQVIASRAGQGIVMVVALSILIAGLIGLRITHSLTDPLGRLQRGMARVAQGEFQAPADLPYDRADELGGLSRSFRMMTAQLAEFQRVRAEFVSMASHELKTPLNVIGGNVEILQEGVYGELKSEQLGALATVGDQVNILTGHVNQLLNLSRFEAGAFDLQPERVSVDDLLSGVRSSFEALARQQQIELITDVEPTAPDAVLGDVDRLRNEVLGNLLSNAFKFTTAGGRIGIKALGSAAELRIEVQDTGEGIPADEMEHIFDKYYQPRSHARALGSGLGLAIARHVVEAHGGRIGVESSPGAGARFWFTVPIGAESAA